MAAVRMSDDTSQQYETPHDSSPTGVQRGWTFLSNHAHVFLCVAREPEVRIRDVAHIVGVTERCVQRILDDLEECGYIARVHHGRRNHYEIHANLPMRHPMERQQPVSSLLALIREPQGPGDGVDEPDQADQRQQPAHCDLEGAELV